MIQFDFKNPDYRPIINDRIRRLHLMENDPVVISAMFKHYPNNLIDFISDWVWIQEPRYSPTIRPLVMFKHQIDYIKWLEARVQNNEDGLVEKTRAMGLTWLCCAYSVGRIIFWEGEKISFGSRKQDLVDKIGDMDSIFEKIRFIFYRLPKCFSQGINLSFMKIINSRNSASITGESGDNIGRGGRSKIYFKDESAYYVRPERIEAALSENSDIKIDISTPNGMDNPFAKKRHSGIIPVYTFHWKDDPRKDQAWYENRKKVLIFDYIIAKELDIDYTGSVEDICIKAKWVRAAVDAHKKISGWETSGMVKAGFDVSDVGKNFNVEVVQKGNLVLDIESWKSLTTAKASRKAYSIAEAYKVQVLKYDAIGVGAGVRAEMFELLEHKTYKIDIVPINSGNTHLIGYWTEERLNIDMFKNYRAQMWWELKLKFKKTWEMVEGLEIHPFDELISIPNRPKLIQQLSQPKEHFNSSGKIGIESKEDMSKRGVESPDEAEALLYCNANPVIKESGGW